MTCSKCGGGMRIEEDLDDIYWSCINCGKQIFLKPSYGYPGREVCATLPIGLRHRVVDYPKNICYD